MSILASDTFTRANQSGWGTASDNETWSHANGSDTLSIASNEGSLVTANNGTINIMRLGTNTGGDMIVLARMAVSNTGSNIAVIGRYVDTSHWYDCLVQSGTVKIEKDVAGTFTTISSFSAPAISANAFFWIKFYIVGTTLQAKCWLDGNTEPVAWSGNATDNALSTGGWGLKGNDALQGAITFQYDHFTVTNNSSGGTLALMGVG